MKSTGLTTRQWLATLALGTLMWAAPAVAQSQSTTLPDNDSDLTRQQLAAFDQFLDQHPEVSQDLRSNPSLVNNEEFVENHAALQQYLQQHPEVREDLNQNPNAVMRQEQRFDRREDRQADRNGDRDMTRGELNNMNAFLESHPEVAEQLRKDPSLVNDQKFVANHPALQQFLAQHSQVRDELRENPSAFMSADARFDQRQDAQGRPAELANLDRFLDSHPEIAEQVRRNPSLMDDKKWVAAHPELRQFLAQHARLQDELRENPNAFMSAEQRFDRREDMRQNMGDRDVTQNELANMDRFMDSHPEIAEQLRKNPSLVDDKRFVNGHPELQQFLAQHPAVRAEYKENPNAFMRQEQGFDRREGSGFGRDRDVTNGELSSFHEFLEGHGRISGELSKNPSLAKNDEYLENHAELQTYLQSHPHVREELNEHPDAFFKTAQTFDSRTGVKGTAKLPTSDPKLK
jgi:uncharacterized protein YlxP (DUF503 family)